MNKKGRPENTEPALCFCMSETCKKGFGVVKYRYAYNP